MQGCTACLRVIKNPSEGFLLSNDKGTDEEELTLKDKLSDCVPELLLEAIQNTILCHSCVGTLTLSYAFRKKCLESQQKVYNYQQQMPIGTPINVGKIAQYYRRLEVFDSDEDAELPRKSNGGNSSSDSKQASARLPRNCTMCNFSCTDQCSFRQHVILHANRSAPYKCDECSFISSTPELLLDHLAGHTKEKPYSCVQCDFATASHKQHKEHELAHLKPFQCVACLLRFCVEGELQEHTKSHSRQQPRRAFQCGFCFFRCNDGLRLEMHVERKHKPKIFKCRLCPAEYALYDDFLMHKQSVHNKESAAEDSIPNNAQEGNMDENKNVIEVSDDEGNETAPNNNTDGQPKPVMCDRCATAKETQPVQKVSRDTQVDCPIPTNDPVIDTNYVGQSSTASQNINNTEDNNIEAPTNMEVVENANDHATDVQETEAPDRVFTCKWCLVEFRTRCSLKNHIRRCKHTAVRNNTRKQTLFDYIYRADRPSVVHTCKFCHYQCSSRASLHDHLLNHTKFNWNRRINSELLRSSEELVSIIVDDSDSEMVSVDENGAATASQPSNEQEEDHENDSSMIVSSTCQTTNIRYTSMEGHTLPKCEKPLEKCFQCKICWVKCKNRRQLKNHQRREHRTSVLPPLDLNFAFNCPDISSPVASDPPSFQESPNEAVPSRANATATTTTNVTSTVCSVSSVPVTTTTTSTANATLSDKNQAAPPTNLQQEDEPARTPQRGAASLNCFKCDQCPAICSSQKNLRRHRRYVHNFFIDQPLKSLINDIMAADNEHDAAARMMSGLSSALMTNVSDNTERQEIDLMLQSMVTSFPSDESFGYFKTNARGSTSSATRVQNKSVRSNSDANMSADNPEKTKAASSQPCTSTNQAAPNQHVLDLSDAVSKIRGAGSQSKRTTAKGEASGRSNVPSDPGTMQAEAVIVIDDD